MSPNESSPLFSDEKQTIEQLLSWREKAVKECENARVALAKAQRRNLDAEQRLVSIESLLATEGRIDFGVSSTPFSRAEFLDAAVAIFEDAGCSLHIRDIRDRLLSREIPLPGKGDDANLITTFLRSKGRIVRIERGIYDIPRPD